jgi:hypothetical protein
MGNFFNNGPIILKLIVRVRIYHILIKINNSVFNLHFMKVSTENDNNFDYEKITIVVDNMSLIQV